MSLTVHGGVGSTAPFLNDYKVGFVVRRWLETIFGGVRPLILSDETPISIHIFQWFMFLSPALLGVPLCIIYDALHPFDDPYIFQLIFGGIMGLYVGLLQLLSYCIRRREESTLSIQALSALLLSDDQDFIFDGCCSADSMKFLLPPKPGRITTALHIVLTGITCGLAFRYLVPSLAAEHTFLPRWLVFSLGWYALCTAQYSLTARAPAEPNQYRSYDRYGMQALTRPLYIIALCIVDVVAEAVGSKVPYLMAVNSALHMLFIALPLLWPFGVLPQFDVLVTWAVEQVFIYLLGGTATASDIRLFVQFIGAWVACIIVHFVRLAQPIAGLAVAAFLGNLLSRNLMPALSRPSEDATEDGTKRKEHILRTVRYFGIAVGVGGVCGGISYGIERTGATAVTSLVAILTAAYATAVLTMAFQRPFLGCLRNPLIPLNTKNKRRIGRVLDRCYWVFRVATPLIQCVLLCGYWTVATPAAVFVQSVFVTRALRWAWQSPNSALEVVIVAWLATAHSVVAEAFALSLLLAALIHLKGFEFVAKLEYLLVYVISSWTKKKLRFRHAKLLYCFYVVFAPIVVANVLTAAVLSAPLLPLLGMPLFLIGFPRPQRMWPTVGGSYNASPDTLYYKQLAPQLKRSLPRTLISGALGEPSAGTHFLLRLESRLVWLHVVERGNGYCMMVIKGLELQETSCHHVEAGKVEEVFGNALSIPGEGSGRMLLNKYFFHTLTPLGTVPVQTYTNSNMVMTGILDNPQNLQRIPRTFFKTLIYCLKQYLDGPEVPPSPKAFPEWWKRLPLDTAELEGLIKKFPMKWYSYLQSKRASSWMGTDSSERDPLVPLVVYCHALVESFGMGGMTPESAGPRHVLDVFSGKIPPSFELEWLDNDPALKQIVLKAYRYAVKIVFDQAVLAEIETFEELEEAIRSLDDFWFVGVEGIEWETAIAAAVPNLFSIGFKDGVYTAHFLALHHHSLSAGRLRSEAVHGQWASLNAELLYFTNDDDERYSIQAHPLLLRNLTIQASEPPLGYPVYEELVVIHFGSV